MVDIKKTLSERSMENTQEFSRAAQASRLIQTAFHPQLKNIKDPGMYRRLTSKLMQILQLDKYHDRGLRTVEGGDLSLLEGFDFCIRKQFRRSIHQPAEVSIDRSAGIATVKLPSFVPIEQIDCQSKFTHLTIQLVVVEIDFLKDRFTYHVAHSADLPHTLPAQVELKGTFPIDSQLPIVIAMGIQVHQEVNGKLYALRESGAIAFQIIKTDVPVAGYIARTVGRGKTRRADDPKAPEKGTRKPKSVEVAQAPAKRKKKAAPVVKKEASEVKKAASRTRKEVSDTKQETSAAKKKTSTSGRRKKATQEDTV